MNDLRRRVNDYFNSNLTSKVDKATIHAVMIDRVDIVIGTSPTVIHHVEVVGDINNMIVGMEVPIAWIDRRPVVVYDKAPEDTNVVDYPDYVVGHILCANGSKLLAADNSSMLMAG